MLVVEDEVDVARLIKHTLDRTGDLQVEIAVTGEAALTLAAEHPPDLVVLDLNLPGFDGLEVCRILRGRPTSAAVKIIMLTARASESDRIRGLDLGADDYMTKPFSPRELAARVRAALRRGQSEVRPDIYRGKHLVADFDAVSVTVDGTPIRLTRREFELLRYLVQNRNRVISRDRLLERVWGYENQSKPGRSTCTSGVCEASSVPRRFKSKPSSGLAIASSKHRTRRQRSRVRLKSARTYSEDLVGRRPDFPVSYNAPGMTPRRDRRTFLQFLGAGLTRAVLPGAVLGPLACNERPAPRATPFTPIQPSDHDALVLPPEFTHDIVALWGDALPGTNARFGYNADYTAFIETAPDGSEGVLFVNHEYVSLPEPGEIGVYLQTFPLVMGREPSVEDHMHDVGASVLQIKRRTNGRWDVLSAPRTRRYDATSPMKASGPALQNAHDISGTIANCSGCHTPWNTVLTCEENYQVYVPDAVDTAGRGSIGGRFGKDGTHFGWVVEIDPLDPSWTPVKHTMLGRFRHENVAIRAEEGRPVVAYMGDDRTNGHVYRFVSDVSYVASNEVNRGSVLSSGHLYAAVFHPDGTGEWREIGGASPLRPTPGTAVPVIPRGAITLGQVYSDLGAMVTDAFRAANLIGATPTGRPEDVEVHPLDKSVYIAFTAAATAPGHLFPNLYGEIWRIEDEDDGTGTGFTWVRWKAGGPADSNEGGHVFAAPDNLSFDPSGNLWVVVDVTSAALNSNRRYATFMNNGMFFIPTSGPDAGFATQFASGPCEAELAGPSWTPDRATLFLSVQHPGEAYGMRTAGMPVPRGSNWPTGRAGDPPLPGVVSIRRT